MPRRRSRVRSPSRAFSLPKSGSLFSVQEGGTLRNGPHFCAKRGAEHLSNPCEARVRVSPRLKSGSVGSAEKRSTGLFFGTRLTPSRVFVLTKSGPLFSVQEGGTLRNRPLFCAKRRKRKKKYQIDLTDRHFIHLDISRKIHPTGII